MKIASKRRKRYGMVWTEYYEDASTLPELIQEVQSIYTQNFFPEMKADWSHYPENIGHKGLARDASVAMTVIT